MLDISLNTNVINRLTTLIKKSIINFWQFSYSVQIFIYILQKERKIKFGNYHTWKAY